MTAAVFYGLAVLFGLWGVYSYLGYRAEKRQWKQRVTGWYGERQKRKSFFVVLGDRFDQTKYAEPLRGKLQQANLPLTPSEFLGMLLLAFMAITVLSNSMFGLTYALGAIIGIIAVIATYYILFWLRKNKYEERLNNQLGEVCRLLGNSVRAGMTIYQGADLVAREVSSPAKEEFQRLSQELKLGVDFEKALKDMQKRHKSREFQLFIATLLIQKRAGGNLYAVLDEMSQTLEERKLLLQSIKTMTAEQRYISYLLPILPVFLVLMMNQIIDGFLKPLMTVPGAILGLFFLGATVLAFILVRKVSNIKV
ncbi:type II secretion system F family protein [Bacillus songklensis]|uniref:Type II secretion system F family protein n=1 Tax=Bacillus songklensis TaxID=1069116 RepID=A0ABV8B2H4_9BACI